MSIKFSDIEDAFLFVSCQPHWTNTAYLDKETGKIYYESDFGDSDELPEDIESEKYVTIPHKNDLDLGRNLVFEFVSQQIPEELDRIHDYFHGSGAYSRYKNFLDRKGLLEKWYAFENNRTKEALLEWCAENDLTVEE